MPELYPTLQEKFNGIIWKVEVDEAQAILAVETRDKDSHTAAFSAFDYLNGKCCFKDYSPEKSWWHGLDRIHAGIIYLHGYKSEGSPERRGIIALDSKTGKIKWQDFNHVLDEISDNGLMVHNALMQFARHEWISHETGQTLKDIGQEDTFIHRHIRVPESPGETFILPDFITENVVGSVLLLEHEGKNCWSFHVRKNDLFVQKLIITENNAVILSDNLADGIPKLNPEAFFVHQNHLFCIRNNNEIVSYLL